MEDFYQAAVQMQRASKILHENKSWHYACYLAGYVIEMGLKTIIYSLDKKKLGKIHILSELMKPVNILEKRIKGITFKKDIITNSRLYAEWKVEKRYEPAVWNEEEISTAFQETATYMVSFLSKLYKEGIIR